ncbi:Anhydro-N-acetylmuramic acid kinase [Candidatus Rhodobacter oscarellae]|uniref:Anhydro-N-acetylmuramic acid kinase n=1 Tax=Candidatus Rhodobacter oscarellae TaxID=1675527 RepID=A0A0J9GTB2_9RHOB|nr:anhydro-N-acetylmuramic acid kinase [Candidatus Rhodobacter lobularis]KMW56723.1 Anhydro-N-acetylmuramic acid kinase [Candidatus Rhodobacter lobularis]
MKIDGPVWALGAMSGTSMDGVDAALLRTDGEEIFEFGESGYRAYSEAERGLIRAAQGRWPGAAGVAEAAEVVETAHAELLSRFDCDLAGFHGQTLAHDPGGRGTHQAGDGAVLAAVLGRPVVWDFRTADVQLGGQGAPLAPFFHHACARWAGATVPVAILNLGGVGNLTWLDPSLPVEEACLAFDTGPANAPMDDYAQAHLGARYDNGGGFAASGTADQTRVEAFLNHPYFSRMPPKSLDRNDFSSAFELPPEQSAEDALATLAAICVASVAKGMEHCPAPPARLLVTGGGRHNAALMGGLAAALPCPVEPVEAVGLNGDMLEAQAFAYLAVRVARGMPTSSPRTTGVAAAVGGGRVSQPPSAIGALTSNLG